MNALDYRSQQHLNMMIMPEPAVHGFGPQCCRPVFIGVRSIQRLLIRQSRLRFGDANNPRLYLPCVNKLHHLQQRVLLRCSSTFPKVDAGTLADFRFQATSREPNIGRFGALLTESKGVRDQLSPSPENRFPASLLLTQMIIAVNRIRIL